MQYGYFVPLLFNLHQYRSGHFKFCLNSYMPFLLSFCYCMSKIVWSTFSLAIWAYYLYKLIKIWTNMSYLLSFMFFCGGHYCFWYFWNNQLWDWKPKWRPLKPTFLKEDMLHKKMDGIIRVEPDCLLARQWIMAKTFLKSLLESPHSCLLGDELGS